jgi:hypothetical protein
MSLILGILAQSAGAVAGGDYESIATVIVGSGGSSTISFTSIPSTYKHLQIRYNSRSALASVTDNLYFAFNSDTGNNYNIHQLFGDGASAGASYDSTGKYPSITAGNSAPSSVFGAGVIDILDYTNTNKNTTVRALSGIDVNGSGGYVLLRSLLWRNTAAITQLDITSGTTWAQYSSFALYGIRD